MVGVRRARSIEGWQFARELRSNGRQSLCLVSQVGKHEGLTGDGVGRRGAKFEAQLERGRLGRDRAESGGERFEEADLTNAAE